MMNSETKKFVQGVKMWNVYFIANIFMYLTLNFIRIKNIHLIGNFSNTDI